MDDICETSILKMRARYRSLEVRCPDLVLLNSLYRKSYHPTQSLNVRLGQPFLFKISLCIPTLFILADTFILYRKLKINYFCIFSPPPPSHPYCRCYTFCTGSTKSRSLVFALLPFPLPITPRYSSS